MLWCFQGIDIFTVGISLNLRFDISNSQAFWKDKTSSREVLLYFSLILLVLIGTFTPSVFFTAKNWNTFANTLIFLCCSNLRQKRGGWRRNHAGDCKDPVSEHCFDPSMDCTLLTMTPWSRAGHWLTTLPSWTQQTSWHGLNRPFYRWQNRNWVTLNNVWDGGLKINQNKIFCPISKSLYCVYN